jgi:hypothetical protein
MLVDDLKNPGPISWEQMKDELGFTEAERSEIKAGAQELIAQARRADARRPQTTRTDPA